MKHRIQFLGLAFMLGLFTSCQEISKEESAVEQTDYKAWIGTIMLNDTTPLNFEFITRKDQGHFWIINGKDTVKAKLVAQDSLYKVEFPVFANYLMLTWGEEKVQGSYINPDGEDYVLPFMAKPRGKASPYPAKAGDPDKLKGSWEMRLIRIPKKRAKP